MTAAEYRAANGWCTSCGKREPISGKKTCRTCLRGNARRRNQKRKAGRCACGDFRHPGRRQCLTCLERQRLSGKNYRQRKEDAGICTHRGCKAPASPGHVHCGPHLEHLRERSAARYQAKADAGLCSRDGCPEAREKGHSLCGPHRAAARAYWHRKKAPTL